MIPEVGVYKDSTGDRSGAQAVALLRIASADDRALYRARSRVTALTWHVGEWSRCSLVLVDHPPRHPENVHAAGADLRNE
jgi:hypothetical protein